MSQETTDNFWKALREIKWPEPTPIFFRLYYKEDGGPIVYTMEDLPGNYIDVDRDTYQLASMEVRVVDGKLVKLAQSKVNKLIPSDTGTHCHPQDVCVIVDQPNFIAWSYK